MADDKTTSGSRKTPTIRSLAEKAGVSISTASKFINGKKHFSAEVESRLKTAIAELGYQADPQASYLITGKTSAVGIVILDINNPHFTGVVKGANRIAIQRNYTVLLVDSEEDERREKTLIKSLARRVDGLVLSSRLPTSELECLNDLGKPIIFLGHLQHSSLCSVGIDSYLGAQMLTWHLLKLGHRKVSYVGFPRSRWNDIRIQAIRDSLDTHGLSPIIFDAGSPDLRAGESSCARVMLNNDPPDAVICYNDLLALGFMKAANAIGLDVPRDVSVVGFDNIVYGGYVTPSLTSIDMRGELLGEVAMSRLLDKLSGKEPGPLPDLQPLLVARNSVRDRNAGADRSTSATKESKK